MIIFGIIKGTKNYSAASSDGLLSFNSASISTKSAVPAATSFLVLLALTTDGPAGLAASGLAPRAPARAGRLSRAAGAASTAYSLAKSEPLSVCERNFCSQSLAPSMKESATKFVNNLIERIASSFPGIG